jgi:hypothetical protein
MKDVRAELAQIICEKPLYPKSRYLKKIPPKHAQTLRALRFTCVEGDSLRPAPLHHPSRCALRMIPLLRCTGKDEGSGGLPALAVSFTYGEANDFPP